MDAEPYISYINNQQICMCTQTANTLLATADKRLLGRQILRIPSGWPHTHEFTCTRGIFDCRTEDSNTTFFVCEHLLEMSLSNEIYSPLNLCIIALTPPPPTEATHITHFIFKNMKRWRSQTPLREIPAFTSFGLWNNCIHSDTGLTQGVNRSLNNFDHLSSIVHVKKWYGVYCEKTGCFFLSLRWFTPTKGWNVMDFLSQHWVQCPNVLSAHYMLCKLRHTFLFLSVSSVIKVCSRENIWCDIVMETFKLCYVFSEIVR